jgi:hypothetical protein
MLNEFRKLSCLQANLICLYFCVFFYVVISNFFIGVERHKTRRVLVLNHLNQITNATCLDLGDDGRLTNNIDLKIDEFEQIESNLENKSIKLCIGGISLAVQNHKCLSQRNIAVLIPYRDRLEALKIFLNNIHPFLTRQRINYGIYLIEPLGNLTFNRGLLLNVGFKEALNDEKNLPFKWDCFFLHDVDMIPENLNNFYVCNEKTPLHYSVAVKKFKYK